MISEQYGSIDPRVDAQIRQLLNTISNLQFDLSESQQLLREVMEQCLFDDDDGVGVSEDVVIPAELFDRICAALPPTGGGMDE